MWHSDSHIVRVRLVRQGSLSIGRLTWKTAKRFKLSYKVLQVPTVSKKNRLCRAYTFSSSPAMMMWQVRPSFWHTARRLRYLDHRDLFRRWYTLVYNRQYRSKPSPIDVVITTSPVLFIAIVILSVLQEDERCYTTVCVIRIGDVEHTVVDESRIILKILVQVFMSCQTAAWCLSPSGYYGSISKTTCACTATWHTWPRQISCVSMLCRIYLCVLGSFVWPSHITRTSVIRQGSKLLDQALLFLQVAWECVCRSVTRIILEKNK